MPIMCTSIFGVCVVIDIIYICLLESKLFKNLNKKIIRYLIVVLIALTILYNILSISKPTCKKQTIGHVKFDKGTRGKDMYIYTS